MSAPTWRSSSQLCWTPWRVSSARAPLTLATPRPRLPIVASDTEEVAPMPQQDERRVDPLDGGSYTFQEILAHYKGAYSRAEINTYWKQSCRRAPPSESEQQSGKTAKQGKAKAAPAPTGKPAAKGVAKSGANTQARAAAGGLKEPSSAPTLAAEEADLEE